jgi:hypothetical protein
MSKAPNILELFESTIAAYFITPGGKMISTNGGSHISLVINSPEKFGFTKLQIVDLYKKYNEKLGVEGKAREQLLRLLIDKGWTRVRRYPNKFWSIQVKKLTKKAKDYLQDFASKILNGFHGFKEEDKYMPMKIDTSNGLKMYTVEKVKNDILYTNEELSEHRVGITFVDLEDLMFSITKNQ